MAKGMSAKDNIFKFVVDKFRRRVVVTLYLITNHLNLLVNLRLRILTMKHHVGKQVNGQPEVVMVYCRIKGGILLVGEGIQLAANPL